MAAFGRKKRYDPYAPPDEGPARAFNRKKKEDVYAYEEDAPKWGIRDDSNVAGAWTTYDPAKGDFNYDERYRAGNTDNAIYEEWNPRGAKFVPDRRVMDDNRAKNEWEVRNRSTLGYGASYRNIAVEVGGDVLSTELSARGGRRQAGRGSQMEKKRVIEERKLRLEEKHAEEDAWRARELSWLALSPEQQEEVRQKRRQNRLEAMEDFRFEVVNFLPDDVQGLGIDFAALSLAEPAIEEPVSLRSSRTSQRTVRPRNDRSRSPGTPMSPRDSGGYRGSAPSEDSGSYRDHESSRDSGSRRGSVSYREHGSYRDRRPPSISTAPATESWIERGSPATPSARSDHPLLSNPLASLPTFTMPQRPRYAGSQAETIFEVGYHPELVEPPADLDIDWSLSGDEVDRASRTLDLIHKLNGSKGRMVTVRIDPKVTVPFPEAVTDRLWGGVIQEIIFNPDSKHAVVIFVTANGCAAFLRHWRAVRDNDAQELRRSQIAVAWYDDSEESSVLPWQPNIVASIFYHGASRVLKIDRIYRDIKKADAEAGFRASVGLDRVICKGRLVVPTKKYEQDRDLRTNTLVVEFASIRDAWDIKELVNNGGLGRDFEGCTAEFARDPCDKPPVARDYCKCRWCSKPGALTLDTQSQLGAPSSRGGGSSAASVASTRR